MNLFRYTLIDLRRTFADWVGTAFNTVLPVLFFLLFGAMQSYASRPLNDGTVMGYVMIGMAVYGGVTAACSTVGQTVVERSSGWGRQLALTPLTPLEMLASKAVVVLARSMFPVIAVNLTGVLAGVEMPVGEWVGAAALSVLVALPFGFYGMIFGQLFRSESAVGAASAGLVVLAFLGNAFSPLPESLLQISRFTPFYGVQTVARYPLGEGSQLISEDPWLLNDPLSWAVINLVAWTLLFAGICALLARRRTGRE